MATISRSIYRTQCLLSHSSNNISISMLLPFCGTQSHRAPQAYMSKIYLPFNFSGDTSRLSALSLYCIAALALMCQILYTVRYTVVTLHCSVVV